MPRTPRQPDESAREAAQRQLHDHLANQDGCITFLLAELRVLQKRVNQLEAWRVRTHTNSEIANQPLSDDQLM